MSREAERAWREVDGFAQESLPLKDGKLACVLAVEVHDVEQVVEDGHARPHPAALETRETGGAAFERDDLAVDDEVALRLLGQGFNDVGERAGQIELVAR